MAETIEKIVQNEELFSAMTKVAFDCVDTDKSGQIETRELEEVMLQIALDLGIDPPSKEDVEEVMSRLDTDSSGQIDYEEFRVFIKDILEVILETLAEQKKTA